MNATITSSFVAAENGERAAVDALFAALSAELRRMAKRELARRDGWPAQSVTTLIHEAWLSLADQADASFPDEAHFLGYAARVIRGLVIEHAKNQGAIQHGGRFALTAANEQDTAHPVDPEELSAISDALDELAKVDPELAELVDLKYFCGFSFAEIGALHQQAEPALQRKWEKARIYLHISVHADLLA